MKLKEQLTSNLKLKFDELIPNIHASSYYVVEEFMTHLISWKFEQILSLSSSYTNGFCLELLILSHHFGSEALSAVYSYMLFKRMSPSFFLDILNVAMSVDGKWLSFKCFEFLTNLLTSDNIICSVDPTRLEHLIKVFLRKALEWLLYQ